MVLKQDNVEPSLILRLVFLGAVILPTFISRKVSYPAVITLFLTLTLYGFSYSYMPYTTNIYAWITVLLTIIFLIVNKSICKLPAFLFFLTVYVFLVDTITGIGNPYAHIPENVFYCFLMLLCFSQFANRNSNVAFEQISFSFLLVSIILSLYFLLNRNNFVVYYDKYKEFERYGWIDPNYFGTVIGMGTMTALIMLFKKKKQNKDIIETIICIFSIVLSIPVLLLNASRGAILSVAVAGSFLIFYARVKNEYKIMMLIVITVILLYLYNNQYMNLLAYRIENDETIGSGRNNIWSLKIDAFVKGGWGALLFGSGYAGGLAISGHILGFHNDFLAFLVDYGIVGLLLFLYMLYYPITKIERESNYYPIVISIVAYIAITGFTLEPISGGRLPYFVFYMQALLLVNSARNHPKENDILKE